MRQAPTLWLEIDWLPFAMNTLAWSPESIGAAARAAFTGEVDPVLADCLRLRQRAGREPLPDAERAFIIARDGEVCRYCGDEAGPFHVDHILAVVRGGTNDPKNLCVACWRCNLSKGARLLAEWVS